MSTAIICHASPIGVLMRGARCGILSLACWHLVHSWQYRCASLAILTQYTSCRNRSSTCFLKPLVASGGGIVIAEKSISMKSSR